MHIVRCFLLLVAGILGFQQAHAQVAEYRLYPGDLIQVSVFDHEDLDVQLRIPTGGKINFPLIGEVTNLTGRTIDELVAELQNRLEDGYIRQAVITATVMEYGPRFVYVMGSVEEPRAIPLSPLAPVTALQAVSQSGGFTDDANQAAVVVIRENLSRPGLRTAIPVKISQASQTTDGDPTLRPYDVVVVPRLDRVYIVGQVQKPGAVSIPAEGELTIIGAITLAGGFGKFAREREVQLLRPDQPPQTIDVRAVLEGDRQQDTNLKPGDTVFVPESRF